MCQHRNAGADVSKTAPQVQRNNLPLAAVSGAQGYNNTLGITRRTQDWQRLADLVVVASFDRDNPARVARLRKRWQGAVD